MSAEAPAEACQPPACPPLVPDAPYAAAVPAALPLASTLLEAEAATTNGTLPAASTSLHTPGAEASGRRYASLAPGQRISWRAPVSADSVVVRYSYPDGADGGGLEFRAAGKLLGSLSLTSRYSWDYGAPRWGTHSVWSSNPRLGSPRHFWDESSLRLPAPFAAEAVIELVNPPGSGRTVLVDFIELEQVPPPVPQPPGSISFAQFQPAADGTTDDTGKLVQALAEAKRAGQSLYVPEGNYAIGSVEFDEGTIQGAGLWRTRFMGQGAQFRFAGGRAHVADIAIFGETTTRNDSSDASNAFAGRPGPGSVLERIWVEHMKCAFWVDKGKGSRGPTELRITACRFRNLMADAVNLCDGTRDSVVDNCQVRNSGDDGLAAWSPDHGTPSGGNNTFAHNLVQSPWVASGIALYGGGPFRVVGNTVKDTVTTGSGIYAAAFFGAHPFTGLVDVRDNTLVRCGAHESDPGGPTGAFRLIAGDRDIARAKFSFAHNRVIAPLESAVSFQGPRRLEHVQFTGLAVEGAALIADVRPDAKGEATFSGVNVTGSESARWRNGAGGIFELSR